MCTCVCVCECVCVCVCAKSLQFPVAFLFALMVQRRASQARAADLDEFDAEGKFGLVLHLLDAAENTGKAEELVEAQQDMAEGTTQKKGGA